MSDAGGANVEESDAGGANVEESDAGGANTVQSDGRDASAELRKLAHILDVEAERLDMISGLPGQDLRTLRTQIGEALFQADKHYFTRVAALTKTVPGAVAAKVTELALPPLIAARTAELLEPRRAVDLVGRISDRYLADVSVVMDASRSPDVIAAIPPERVAKVALELAKRKEWVVIGGFVTQVTNTALAASVAQFNGEQLLRIGYFLDDLSRLDDIGGMLTERQIDQMLAAAAQFELWAELADLLGHLSAERLTRMSERYVAADEPLRATFRAATDQGALDAAALVTLSGA